MAANPQRPDAAVDWSRLELWRLRLESDLRAIVCAAKLLPAWTRSPMLRRIAWQLLLTYPNGRAYRLAKEAGETGFGETPLFSALGILRDAQAKEGQTLVELGCGPGRLSLAGAGLFGLRCRAVDRVTGFIVRGNAIADRLKLNLRYEERDLWLWEPDEPEWLYVAGTSFSARLRQRLAETLAGSRARVLSVTAPLGIESHEPRLLGCYPFLWGRDRVFLECPRTAQSLQEPLAASCSNRSTLPF